MHRYFTMDKLEHIISTINNQLLYRCMALTIGVVVSNTAYSVEALDMVITAKKMVENADGKMVYVPVRTANVGAIIQYKATYQNTHNHALRNTSVTIPIPTNTEFTGHAFPPSAQGSIDYRNYMDIPLMRLVDGKLEETPFSDYKSLRWNIKYIPPRKSVDVAFNTIVK